MAKNDVDVIIVDGIITLKYREYFKKQRQGLQKSDEQPCRRFLREDFGIQIIMDCRTKPSVKFKTRLGFNQQDPIMTQEQSVLTKIKSAFSTEEIIYQHSVLRYRIDAYFLKHRLAIEADELGHNTRDLECEIERQKAVDRELNCKLIRINPSKENLNIFDEISCKYKKQTCKLIV